MLDLPEYPWQLMAPYKATAQTHPAGLVDLSIGAPVDPTPDVIQQALRAGTNWPGYPGAAGTNELRDAIAQWYHRRRSVKNLTRDNVAATVGSKEFIAWLPLLLGLGPDDVIVYPTVAYPTYDIGAKIVGATSVTADSLAGLDEETRDKIKLVWVNSPANPTGIVQEASALRALVNDARGLGAVVASDECYAELGWGRWDTELIPSILHSQVAGEDFTGLLSVYSLSKQSNMAGYRAAFVAGDTKLIAALINLRSHTGMVVPGPIQQATIAALADEDHVAEQKARYRNRREKLVTAIEAAGLVIEHSQAGLYLWVRDPTVTNPTAHDSWELVDRFAKAGMLVGPGVFYSSAGNGYIRISITATDQDVDQAVSRLKAGL
ncbi:MAG TPA: succinyldiaminopimelate transaminase [Enteractinococcus helveticum]|uniref:Aminotransferase n=1 Tax=Enteractinococcus helveticum TaxID=1837282 RepID=A0A921FLP5_9MICC|nr:succinyldiaminopimelate transaminase [Enteractinococcus helveticum]HJF14358.1 succinyldiaminopimelate transaminase [Enteractinococcus helveticum]